MFQRIAAGLSLLMVLSLLGCGGGGGGGGDDSVRVTPSTASLQFSGVQGDLIASQDLGVTLTSAPGGVFAAVEVADISVASASFNITGGTSAVITVTPSAFRTPGTYQTTVFLRVYRNQTGTDLLATFSYGVTLTVRAGLSVSPTTLALNTLEGGTTQGTLAVTLPQGVSGIVSASLAAGQASAPWLNLSVLPNNSVQVDASAVALAAGTYTRDLEISVLRPTGSTAVRVPLTFTVGVGLVAPANQTLLLERSTPLASLQGSVTVQRGDGAHSAWTATSSAPWLVLASNAGTTPDALTYSVDPAQLASLGQFADHTATVTLSTAGLTPVSFTVTLQKRLPYVVFAGPYGLPYGASTRIIVGGRGFNQLGTSPAALLLASGLSVDFASVLSDTQLLLFVTAQSQGPFTIGVPNVGGVNTPSALLWFSAPYTYAPATVPHTGAKNIYLHDPVRHAVFALSRSANALVRYQVDGNGVWSVATLPIAGALNMAMAPDGSRIWVTDQSHRVIEVDPDNQMAQLNSYVAPNFAILQNIGGVLPISSDGRLWLPGSAHYFDLLTRSFGAVDTSTVPFNFEFGAYHGTLDGTLVLISPSFQFTPTPPWGAYQSLNEAVYSLASSTNLGYEPRLSLYGSRVLEEFSGRLYSGPTSFAPGDMLPTPPDTDSYFLVTLTPDGNKILVLRKTYTSASQTTLASQAIDVYSTSPLITKIGSIPLTTDASFCTSNSDDCFYGNQYLLPTQDSKAVFWIGNQNLQVFNIP